MAALLIVMLLYWVIPMEFSITQDGKERTWIKPFADAWFYKQD